MICGFREPTVEFTQELDHVMERITARMAGVFNRYVLFTFVSNIDIIASTSEPYFYTNSTRINRLIPTEMRELLESQDYYVAAVWNAETVTEVYILNYECDSDEYATLESLSQSFSIWLFLNLDFICN